MNLSSAVAYSIIDILKKFRDPLQQDYLSENYIYDSGNVIGSGEFGDVYKAVPIQVRAMKVVKISYEENYSKKGDQISKIDGNRILNFVQCCQEACLMSDVFMHPNIVKVHDKWIQRSRDTDEKSAVDLEHIQIISDFLKSKDKTGEIPPLVAKALISTEGLSLYMVMDFYETDLGKWLDKDENKVQHDVKASIIEQIIYALAYIHQKGYCHADLKPSNILLRQEKSRIRASLNDFGLSVFYKPTDIPYEYDSRPGASPYNTAPDRKITDKFDVWAFGVLVYYILRSGVAASEMTRLCDIAKVRSVEPEKDLSKIGDLPENLSKFVSIIPRCLERYSIDRISIKDQYKELIEGDIPVPIDSEHGEDSMYLSARDESMVLTADAEQDDQLSLDFLSANDSNTF